MLRNILIVISVFAFVGCSDAVEKDTKDVKGKKAKETKEVSANYYTRLVGMYNDALVKLKNAKTVEELDAINNTLDSLQTAEKHKSAAEIVRINNEIAENAEAYKADIDAEKKAWDAYEEAYLGRRLELRGK